MAQIDIKSNRTPDFFLYAIERLPKIPDISALVLSIPSVKTIESFLQISRNHHGVYFSNLNSSPEGNACLARCRIDKSNFADLRDKYLPAVFEQGCTIQEINLQFNDVKYMITIEESDPGKRVKVTSRRIGSAQDKYEPAGAIGSWWNQLRSWDTQEPESSKE